MRDRIGDCRSGGPLGRFPGADAGELRPVYQLDLDGGDLAEFQDRVLLPAKTCDAAFAELHLLLQRPAGRLNRATLDLVDHAVRVDDEPDVDGEKQPLHAYFMIDLHLGDHRAVCAEVLVFCESDAVTAALTGGPVPPARAPRHRLDYRAGTRVDDRPAPRIFEVAHAEGDHVDFGSLSELVHEGLDRKHVGVGAQRTQRRGAYWHLVHVVVDDALIRKIVYRNGVAVRRSRGERHVDRRGSLERPRQMPGCDEGGTIGAAGPAAVAVAPQLVLPVDYAAVRGERRAQGERHRRPARGPGEFVVAHPLHLHGTPACGPGKQRRIERNVVGTVMSVAASPFLMAHDDRVFTHTQRRGQIAAQIEYSLAVAPYQEFVVLELSDRAGRTDRGMRDIGLGIGRLERFRRPGLRLGVRFLADDAVFDSVLFEPCVNVLRQRSGVFPRCRAPQSALGGDRNLLSLGDDADKAAITRHRHDARHRFDLSVVQRCKRREAVRRANHAAIDHSGQSHVLDEAGLTGYLAGEIKPWRRLSDQAIVARRFQCCPLVDLDLEQRIVRAFPEARAATGCFNGTVLNAQIAGRYAQTRSGALKEQSTRLRASAAQRRAGVLDRETSRSDAFVGTHRSIGRDHVDSLRRDPELLGRDLREGGKNSLADLYFADKNRHGAVAAYAQPLRQPRILLQASRMLQPAVGNDVHEVGCADARSTARTIRLCEPQRQRLRSSAARTSLSVGRGFIARSAAALMRMPLMQ